MDPGGDNDKRDVRRPMNAFLIFCKRHRSIVREKNPDLDNRSVTRILGDLWANLKESEKVVYTDLAKQYKDAFMKANPDYKWHNPEKTTAAQKLAMPKPTNVKVIRNDLDVPEGSIMPGKLADPSNMGGLSLLLIAGQQSDKDAELTSPKAPVAVETPGLDPVPVPSPVGKVRWGEDSLAWTTHPEPPQARDKEEPTLRSGPLTSMELMPDSVQNRLFRSDTSLGKPATHPQTGPTLTGVFTSEASLGKGAPVKAENKPPVVEPVWNLDSRKTENQTKAPAQTWKTDTCILTKEKEATSRSLLALAEMCEGKVLPPPSTETAPKPLLFQAMAAPKVPQRSLLAEAFLDTCDKGGYPDILKDNSASAMKTKGDNPIKTENKLEKNEGGSDFEEKENISKLMIKDMKSSKDPDEESPMITCGKLVVNHIIDRLFSSDIAAAARKAQNGLSEKAETADTCVAPREAQDSKPFIAGHENGVGDMRTFDRHKNNVQAFKRNSDCDYDEPDGTKDSVRADSDTKVAASDSKAVVADRDGELAACDRDSKLAASHRENLTASDSLIMSSDGYSKLPASDREKLTASDNKIVSSDRDTNLAASDRVNKQAVSDSKVVSCNRDSKLASSDSQVQPDSSSDENSVVSYKDHEEGDAVRQETDASPADQSQPMKHPSPAPEVREDEGYGEGEMEDAEDYQPVRKSRRRNRGQRYQELINEGIIQPSKERMAALKHDPPKEECMEEDFQSIDSYILPETAIRRIRKRTTSESAKDKILPLDDAKRYKTGDFDLEAHIATLPACPVESMGRKRGFIRQRHHSESTHIKKTLEEHHLPVFDIKKAVSLPPHVKIPSPEKSAEPVVGSRKRKARKHSITHLLPAPPTMVPNGSEHKTNDEGNGSHLETENVKGHTADGSVEEYMLKRYSDSSDSNGTAHDLDSNGHPGGGKVRDGQTECVNKPTTAMECDSESQIVAAAGDGAMSGQDSSMCGGGSSPTSRQQTGFRTSGEIVSQSTTYTDGSESVLPEKKLSVYTGQFQSLKRSASREFGVTASAETETNGNGAGHLPSSYRNWEPASSLLPGDQSGTRLPSGCRSEMRLDTSAQGEPCLSNGNENRTSVDSKDTDLNFNTKVPC